MGNKSPHIRSRKCTWKKNKQKSFTFTKCFSFQDLQKLILQHRDQILQQPKGSQARFLSSLPSSQGQHKYHFQKTFTVSQSGNCRIMTYCDLLSCLVVSQPSPQASFLPGEQFRTSAFMYIFGLHLFIFSLFWKIQNSLVGEHCPQPTKSPFLLSFLFMQIIQSAAKMSLLFVDFIL